jgi:methenyltetrahydrofolate cyclohydrolase
LASSDPLQGTVVAFLDAVASETPAPGGGAVAAVAVALGAALVEMAARFSASTWAGAEGALAAAQALRARAASLAGADADAFGDYLAARRLPADDPGRPAAVEEAAARAVAVPLEIAECGSEIATLAASLVEHGNPTLRGDAIAAARAASSGAAIASKLVEINLDRGPDERLDRARELAAAAARAADRATAA